MSRAKAQRKERVQSPQRFAGLIRFHILGFIQNENRAGFLQILVGQALAGQFFGGFENDVAGFVERIEGDDQDFDKGAGGKGAQLAQARAVVFNQVDGFVFVQGAEVVAGDFEGFDDAFVDGKAGDDDDEFAKAVAFAQFVDGAQVDVGFAGAGFHFDSETGGAPGVDADAFDFEAVVHFERAKHLAAGQVAFLLHLAQVVVEPGFAQAFVGRQVGDDFAAEREFGGAARQAVEQPGEVLDGGGLVRLVGVELEF